MSFDFLCLHLYEWHYVDKESLKKETVFFGNDNLKFPGLNNAIPRESCNIL